MDEPKYLIGCKLCKEFKSEQELLKIKKDYYCIPCITKSNNQELQAALNEKKQKDLYKRIAVPAVILINLIVVTLQVIYKSRLDVINTTLYFTCIPVYYLWYKIIFYGPKDFGNSVKFYFKPNIISDFDGELKKDHQYTVILMGFIMACFLSRWAEYKIIEYLFYS